MQKKLVRKGRVFNLTLTHIHHPPVDDKTGHRPLKISQPHKLHIQNLKKKMKINPHVIVASFIVMVDPDECLRLEDFDVRNTSPTNITSLGDRTRQKQEGNWSENTPLHTSSSMLNVKSMCR